MRLRRPLLAAWLVVAAAGLPACGGDDDSGGKPKPKEPTAAAIQERVEQATSSTVADFPPAQGRTLQQIADTVKAGPQVGLATLNLLPGKNRFAFGLIDERRGFIYGKTALYVAPTPEQPAEGPFPAPADSLITDGAFRSRTAAAEDDPFAAIYTAQVPFERPGKYAVLAVTRDGAQLIGAPTEVTVLAPDKDTVAKVGQPAPRVDTDTVVGAGGDVASIDTRLPPSEMHENSFKKVVGTKPVILLFATPALCQSQVCGPVTDIAAQLQSKYGDRVEFIHQEVYVDNDLKKGLRPSLKAFGLRSEPWLFAIDREGRVVQRLEGSFGIGAMEEAVKAVL